MYEHCCPICGEPLRFELAYSCGSPVAHWFCNRCNYDSWNEHITVTTNTPIDFNDNTSTKQKVRQGMKCPYQTITTHESEHTDKGVTHFAKDIVEFGDCVKTECPFYRTYTNWELKFFEQCRRAELEVSNDK